MKEKKQPSEAAIINLLKLKFDSIGDDAAILPLTKTRSYVLTKDLLIEDIHFTVNQDAATLARKALEVNLSVLAAMGATPHSVLLGISLPSHYFDYINSFLTNFVWACKDHNITLIGGDTSRSSDKFFISMTTIGTILNKNIKYRHTAENGDLLYVAGCLGDAHIGLIASKNNKGLTRFARKYYSPKAKLAEGAWLGKQKAVTAMMDLSDGLYIHLKKICQSANLAAFVNLDGFSTSPEFKRACKYLQLDRITTQLIGGEDYGLLFSVQANKGPIIAKMFYKKFGYELQYIGKLGHGKGVQFIKNRKPIHLDLKPFTHFSESE